MKVLRIILCGLLILALQTAMANGSTSVSPGDKPYYGKKMGPAVKPRDDKRATRGDNSAARGDKKAQRDAKKKKWIPRPNHGMTPANDHMLVVTMVPGSLKANVVRIARNCGWNTVIWNVPEDYVWVGYTQIVGPDLYNVLFRILAKYPLQAQLYQGNRVLAIVPRNLP